MTNKRQVSEHFVQHKPLRHTILLMSPLLFCIGLFVFCRVWGTIYYLRAANLQKTLKPGISRSQVYRELDDFFPHVIETPTYNNPGYCVPDQPDVYYMESAQFAGPFGLRPGGILIVMCFDESGRLVYVR